jgi:hypothetical protein
MASSKDLNFSPRGGCACGLIRYCLTQPPLIVHCCHCTACQRQTGSAFAINAAIEAADVMLLPSASPSIAGSKASPDPVPTGVTPAFASGTDAASVPATTETPQPLNVCLPSESGLGTTVVRCPTCFTGLWSYYADGGPHIAYVRVGTLDKPWEVEPDVHIYTRSRRAFVDIADGKPQFSEYYPSREALLRPDALERWEKWKVTAAQWRIEVRAAIAKEQRK